MYKVYVLISLLLAGVSFAAEINVPADYSTIQAAIDAAVDCDTVIVSAGRYIENINMLGKAITLQSVDPTDPTVVASTIIDGNAAGSVIVCSSDEGADTVISGFVITNGSGTDMLNNGWIYGGGMFNYQTSPTVTNCTFIENTARCGGGMYNENSYIVLTDCTFSGNTADQGGGMYNMKTCPTVTGCIFSDNTARSGGGMFNQRFSRIVSNCTFIENMASDMGGGMVNWKSQATFSNCTFSRNTCDKGGGMFCYSESPKLSNCTFDENGANKGGGLYIDDSAMTIDNCVFDFNDADNEGGGIYSAGSTGVMLDHCRFTSNKAGENGGGIGGVSRAIYMTDSYFCQNQPNAAQNGYFNQGFKDQGNTFLDLRSPSKWAAFLSSGDTDSDWDMNITDFAAFAQGWLRGVE